jgi:hypothetical protein
MMAEQQPHLADHNFSGPKVEKKDAGLPTMIVFDLDGKSQLLYGTARMTPTRPLNAQLKLSNTNPGATSNYQLPLTRLFMVS